MNNPNIQDNDLVNNQQEQTENQINLSELWFNCLDKWYYFAIVVVLAMIIALFVNRFSTPKYEASTSLLIKTNDEILNSVNVEKLISNKNTNQDFQNAIGTIQSFTLTKRTIKAMGLYCNYYEKINLRNIDIYKDSPFEVVLDPLQQTQPTGINIKVKFVSNKVCEISYAGKIGSVVYDYALDKSLENKVSVPKREDVKLAYDTWYTKDGMKFKILLKQNWSEKLASTSYSFKINDLDALTTAYNTTKIDLINKEATIVTIKFRDQNKQKAVDFVNMLCKIYIDQTFEEKNHLNVATINFVNTQISSVGDSLAIAEARRENFQQAHNTLNLTNDGQYLYTKSNELEIKRAEEYTRQQYYKYLSDYLKKSELTEGIASPSVMGVEDLNLNNLINELTKAIIAYKTAVDKRTEKNPKTKELVVTLETLRKQISESLANLKNVSDINMRELQRQQNELQVEIDRLPSTERNMISLERQFKFNDEIYTFLYQKRSEAEIAKNAALPDHKVIDEARTAMQVFPKNSLNYLIALVLGLLLPALYIFLKYITKDTLDSKDDLEKISSNPIFGYIPEFPKEYSKMVVFDRPRSQITEAYRSIRTNIKYVLDSKNIEGGQCILVTSSMPSEGKSITSFNIASVMSISGGKTLLVEYDLRKPRLAKTLNLNGSIGISSYFIGETTIEQSIQHTDFDNLDVLLVGATPPNPSEIIDSQKNKDLLAELRQRYEYIILDTPPVNLITDAQVLAKLADISLYVVRLNYTSLSIMKSALSELEQNSGIKANFILNGVKTVMQKYGYGKNGRGYGGYGGYGYGYGNRYGYGKYGNNYGYGYGDYIKEHSYGYFEDDKEDLKRHKHSKKK
jgi:tyrosine-protein kinase Etk/Wzc